MPPAYPFLFFAGIGTLEAPGKYVFTEGLTERRSGPSSRKGEGLQLAPWGCTDQVHGPN